MSVFVSDIKEVSSTKFLFTAVLSSVLHAGALRRILMCQIPTQAIFNVSVLKNNSNMPDEVLSHRLQFIPIKNDRSFTGGLEVSLSVRGPCKCLSKHLISPLEPTLDDLLLVVLEEGEEIQIKAEIGMGRGDEHVRWCPTTCVVYRANGNSYHFSVEHLGILDYMTLISNAVELLKAEL